LFARTEPVEAVSEETLSRVVSAQLRWKGRGLLTWAVPLARRGHLVVCCGFCGQ